MRANTPGFILFDLDGTISDPLPGFARSINYALAHFDYPIVEPAALAKYIGPPLEETLKTVSGETSPGRIGELVLKYRERYGDVGYSENVLYAGMPEAIAMLAAAKVPLAVCTSKRTDFAERILRMFNLQQHFSFVSGGDIGIQKWQQIESLLAAGTISSSSIMVGDRSVDMIAAHRNGLQAGAVLWGHGSKEELVAESPEYIFQNPPDLGALAGE